MVVLARLAARVSSASSLTQIGERELVARIAKRRVVGIDELFDPSLLPSLLSTLSRSMP